MSALTYGLATRGHHVTLCSTDVLDATRRLGPATGRVRRAPLPPRVVDGVEWRIFPNLSNRAAFRWQAFAPIGLSAYLAEHAASFDVAHLHACHNVPGILAARALSKAGVPWVISPNGTAPIFERRLLEKRVLQQLGGDRVLRDARFVLAVSQAEERQLLALGVPAASIRRVPNPVDTREFFDARGSYRFANRRGEGPEATILFIGKITPRKNLDVVVEAFARLTTVPARLVIAGSNLGGLETAMARAKALNVAGRIEVVGVLPSDRRLQAMANADVVVYPSSDEVFGLVACEALLVGTPVIVGSDSGCAEVVGNCGIAVKPGDTTALAAAMATALRGPADERRSRLAGRERILKQFNVRTVTETLDAVYREVLESGAERRTA
ncbi:MAG: glycosyltransferase [Vicinamibacterales bacterium]